MPTKKPTQLKSKAKLSSKKLSYKNPAVIIVIVLLVAAGVFLVFHSFAATAPGTISASSVTGKDAYGCPRNYTQRPTIAYGSAGSCVKSAQNELNASRIGINIAVDGQFGPATKAAVIKFQSYYHGMTVDGIVGPVTWRSLTCMGVPGDVCITQ